MTSEGTGGFFNTSPVPLFRQVLACLLACTGLALLLTACADPAKDAPKAIVRDPAPSVSDDAAQNDFQAPTVPDTAEVYTFVDSSTIGFEGSKVVGSHVGGFAKFHASIVVPEEGIEHGTIHIEINMDSIYSDDPELTPVLKGADFFDVRTYPGSSFHSTKIVEQNGGYTVTGNLQLHGVTKSITFPATIQASDERVAAQSEFSIKRFDFGITYPGIADDLIRDDVLIFFDIEALKKQP